MPLLQLKKVAEPVNDLKELKQEIIASPMIGQVVKLENVFPDEYLRLVLWKRDCY